MKILSFFSFLFILTSNCILHSVSIEDKLGVTAKLDRQTKKTESIPVNVQFGKSKNKNLEVFYKGPLDNDNRGYKNRAFPFQEFPCSDKSKIFTRKDKSQVIECELGESVKQNHFSEEYFSKFQRSKNFSLHTNSNLKIQIDSVPSKEIQDSIASLLWVVFSLGAFPSKVYTNAYITFQIIDRKANQVLKTYNYMIEHRIYKGIVIPLFGVILPIFSDRFDHSKNMNTYSIARVVFNEFEEDFLKDFDSDTNLQKSAYLLEPPVYSILTSPSILTKDKSLAYFNSKLESTLVARGLKLVKSNSDSKTDSKLQIGKIIQIENFEILKAEKEILKFTISCIDKNTSAEVWSRDYNKELSAYQSKEESIDEIIKFLINDLVNSGEID